MNYVKDKIKLDGIKTKLLQPRHLMLLETGNNKYVALRAVRTNLSFLNYNFVNDSASFLPLAPVKSTGTTKVTQNFFAQHVSVNINALSLTDALAIGGSRNNNLMQVFYGIAPSYIYVDLEYPASTLVNQGPQSSLSPSSTYPYFYGHSGFDSPYYEPSEFTEFFSISNIPVQFTLVNSVAIEQSPKMLFILNNITVEPVHDLALFKKMIEGTTPREIITLGQIYTEITWSPAMYASASPVSAADVLSGNTAVLKEAGY